MKYLYFNNTILSIICSSFIITPLLSKYYDDNAIINDYFDENAILQNRKNNDSYFQNSDDSPLTQKDKKNFTGLKYFPPVRKFAFYAEFVPIATPDTVTILTSKKNKTRRMLKAAKIKFKYSGADYQLHAYLAANREMDETSYFVPFTDLTNGHSTYEAGRYIDIHAADIIDNRMILDFNLAYNPYCAYNKKYSCPLVPLDNHLDIKIEAGEKKLQSLIGFINYISYFYVCVSANFIK